MPAIVGSVACPPYDVVSREEAAERARGNPVSFLHIIRAEIDLPDVDAHDPRVYARARRNLDLFYQEGTFLRDAAPALFVYELTWEGRTQTGVAGCLHVDDYAGDVIRKHETTRPDKEDDRTRHILALNAQAEPVLLAYAGHPIIAKLNAGVVADADPLYDFEADGVRHRVWKVSRPDAYVDAFRRVEHVYVADGHHRSASAWRAAGERRAANPAHTGDEEYNWFLGVLFPASQLRILPYHRVVRDLGGLSAAQFLARLKDVGTLERGGAPVPEHAGAFGVYADGSWHRLTLDGPVVDLRDPARSLDAAQLQERVLAPILGITDVRTDPRIDFVGGIRGPEELERRVAGGEAAAAFALHPVTVEQLMTVSDHGGIMPPKSTWFEPKLRSGLFLHSFD